MSRLYRRGETWWVDYVDERGQRVRKGLPGVTLKRDAEGELAELVAQARRRKLGLQATAVKTDWTVWDLVAWWLDERCPAASVELERGRLTKHVHGTELGDIPVLLVDATHFNAFFAELARPHADAEGEKRRALAGASVNHVRAKLRTAFEAARREGKYTGVNPLLDTTKLKTKRRVYETLTLEEVPRVLAYVAPQWRGFVATAVFLALRKGEIGGALKADVDLVTRTFRVGRSWERQTTKGGEEAELPIPGPLVPYLETALKTPGPYLFPDAKGGMLPRESDPHLRLRTALKRAGIAPERIRRIRLHDMRHTTATILLRAGESLHHVQRILRHASSDTTSGTYAHLVTPDLRAAMQPLEAGTPAAQPTPNPDDDGGPNMQTPSTIPARFERATPGFGGHQGHGAAEFATERVSRTGTDNLGLESLSEASRVVPFAARTTDLAHQRHNPTAKPFRGGMLIDDDPPDIPASSTAGVRRG